MKNNIAEIPGEDIIYARRWTDNDDGKEYTWLPKSCKMMKISLLRLGDYILPSGEC